MQQPFTTTSPTLLNVDFSDYLTEVGYVILYGVVDEAGAYTLSRQQLESSSVLTQATGTPASNEENFDFEFISAQSVKGNLYVNVTIAVDGSAGTAGNGRVAIRIIHYDGSSETEIAAQQTSSDLFNPGSTAQDEARYLFTFAVDKHFKRGDTLRVETIITIDAGNANNYVQLYHDGANRDLSLVDQFGVAAKSNFIVQLPFPAT